MVKIAALVFPVFAVILAGVAAGRARLANAEDNAALNKFVFRFAMPAALFGLTSGAHGLQPADFRFALGYGAPALVTLLAAYAFARGVFRRSPREAGIHALASAFGNAVFLGLPIALSVEGWARPFVVLMLVEGTLIIGVGAALIDGATNAGLPARISALLFRPFRNPLVAAAVGGFLLASFGVAIPLPARAALDILGKAAGGAALFSLGLFFATRPAPKLGVVAGNVAAITLFKMALLPVLTFTMLRLLGVADPSRIGAAALFTATPVAVGAFVMAGHYKAYETEIAATLALTTVLAMFSIPAVLIAFA